MKPKRGHGHIIGTPGGSLGDSPSWAANEGVAAAGRKGELATASILDRFARPGGPTVLHDLAMPATGNTANIDHILVSGQDVYIFDSKTWAPAFYWTFRRRTRRGFQRFENADGKGIADTATMKKARQAIFGYLPEGVRVHRPVVVVWSSRTGRASVWLYRPCAAVAITGRQLMAYGRIAFPRAPADPEIVDLLARLVR